MGNRMGRRNQSHIARLDQTISKLKESYEGTPLIEVGHRLKDFLEETKAAIEAGSAQASQAKKAIDYVDSLIQILPSTFGDRFDLDAFLIQSVAKEWSTGTVRLPNTIIPNYGRQWGHNSVNMPSESLIEANAIDIIVFQGDNNLDDIDLLSYPWLCHELAHALLTRHGKKFGNDFTAELSKEVNRLHLRSLADRGATKDRAKKLVNNILNLWLPDPKEKNWTFELASDLIALWTCGPSFLSAFHDAVNRDGVDPYKISKGHPPYVVRARALVTASREVGWTSEYLQPLEMTMSKWEHLKKSNANELAAYAASDIVRSCLSCSIAACRKLELPLYDSAGIKRTRETLAKGESPKIGTDLLTAAWALFNDQKDQYDTWERRTIQTLINDFKE
ncbi:MAG: hypothetical protein HY788_22735 [Deltaproteobacteria bacterium]|nr:hypothetical protein [Deltaproteobacteria bacterium]